MLKIYNKEHFDEVKKFAEATGQLENLQNRLRYLDNYAKDREDIETKCILFKDFAPYSFEFVMMKREKGNEKDEWTRWFNGGLIYFGPGESGVGEPQYSVRLGDTSKAGWSIHT